MEDFLKVLGLAALPAIGNLVGSLFGELAYKSAFLLASALHMAAGVVLAVVAVELMPEAIASSQPWVIVLAFLAGGVIFVGIDAGADWLAEQQAERGAGGHWVLFFSIVVDLFTDGLMIGTGSSYHLRLGFVLSLGLVLGDIPEGFATLVSFKARGVPLATRLLVTLGLVLPALVGGATGYWAVRGQSELVKMSLLAAAAGILVTAVVEEIMPQAHAGLRGKLEALSFLLGFAMFTLLTGYVH